MDLTGKVADLEKRLLALKAQRPVNIAQVNMLTEEWEFSVSLASGSNAVFQIDVVCADHPIVDVGTAALPFGLAPNFTEWFVDANEATIYMWIQNGTPSTISDDVTVKVWALNGLTADCERIL